MSRIRYIKPEFFLDSDLGDLQPLARILFAGLWTLADREGRTEDKPRDIRVQVLPHDDTDRSAPLTKELLEELAAARLIVRYECDGERYIAIPSWSRHQKPYNKEPPSFIPAPPKLGPSLPASNQEASLTERKVIEGKGTSSENDGFSVPVDNSIKMTVDAEDPPDLFTLFWTDYPRKAHKDEARDVFKGLSRTDQRAAVMAARGRAKYDAGAQTPKNRIPEPATFLRKGRWKEWVKGRPEGYETEAASKSAIAAMQEAPVCASCENELTAEDQIDGRVVDRGDRVDWYCAKCAAKGER